VRIGPVRHWECRERDHKLQIASDTDASLVQPITAELGHKLEFSARLKMKHKDENLWPNYTTISLEPDKRCVPHLEVSAGSAETRHTAPTISSLRQSYGRERVRTALLCPLDRLRRTVAHIPRTDRTNSDEHNLISRYEALCARLQTSRI
jgi:hypothetical protein